MSEQILGAGTCRLRIIMGDRAGKRLKFSPGLIVYLPRIIEVCLVLCRQKGLGAGEMCRPWWTQIP
jgi:hypothetical protein